MCYRTPRTENCTVTSAAKRHRTCQVQILGVCLTEWNGQFLFQVMIFFHCHHHSKLKAIDEFLVQNKLDKDDQLPLIHLAMRFNQIIFNWSTEQ